MKYKDDNFLGFFFIILISFFGIILITILLSALAEYTNYKTYEKERYEVQYNTSNILFPICEIKLINQDGSETWEKCSFIGNNYVLKNFAKTKEGKK